jgi:hypothetical protein
MIGKPTPGDDHGAESPDFHCSGRHLRDDDETNDVDCEASCKWATLELKS